MDDYFRSNLRNWKSRFKGAKKQKKNIALISIILILGMGLFFYLFFDTDAHAQKASNKKTSLEKIDPLSRIDKGIDPKELKCQRKNSFCDEIKEEESVEKESVRESKLEEMIAGHPIEKMFTYISQKDKKVAAYLVAIGNKESEWGLHSPKKDGKDCYNYWGYRGRYNPTDSGYSCFDTPEQAVDEVGRRIAVLIDGGVDNPQKMIAWKCGSSCKGHNSKDNKEWVEDVDYYYQKLN